MLSELVARRNTLPILGKGAFGKVYEVRTASAQLPTMMSVMELAPMIVQRVEVRVLKVAVPDGSADWIEWCYHRMKEFGEDSIEMDGLPRVYEFERIVATEEEDFRSTRIRPGDKLWACIMEKYDYTASEWVTMDRKRASHNEFARKMEERFAPVFGQWFFNDMHGGNVMWSIKRGGYVLTDPSCSEATGRTPRQQPTFGTSIEYSRVREERPEGFERGQQVVPGCGCAMCQGMFRGAEERAAMKGMMGRDFEFKKFGGFSVKRRQMIEPQFRFDKVNLERMWKDDIMPLKGRFENIGKNALRDMADLMMLDLAAMKPIIEPIKAQPVQPIGPGRNRKVADWKVPQLQRQQHMR